MGQMTVEQWYGTIKTGLTKKLTENKEALPAGFNQQRFILNCITVIQDMMKDDKKKAQLEKINPETIPVCLAKAAYLGLDFFNGECYAIPYGGSKPNYPLVIVLLLMAGIFWPLVILFAVFVPLTFLLMDKMGQLHPKDDEMDPEEDTYL